jgi:hypothetical protein
MPLHAFVDESKRRGLLLVAVTLASTDVTAVRSSVRDLHLRQQSRIHFRKESTGRKHAILDAIVAAPLQGRLYQCGTERHELAARQACLARIAEDLVGLGVERLVLERDDSTVAHDQRTLYERVTKLSARDRLRYDHLRAAEEALLALPDAVAWCWAEGGRWRQRVRPLVADVVRL